jgi:hypothetical protein
MGSFVTAIALLMGLFLRYLSRLRVFYFIYENMYMQKSIYLLLRLIGQSIGHKKGAK